MKPYPAAMMACLLLAPLLAAAQGPDCASEPAIHGVPLSERITFLESGQRDVCARGYSRRDCNFAFGKMVERLSELRQELATGCRQIVKSNNPNSNQAKPPPKPSFAEQRARLKNADHKLEQLQGKMRQNTTAMRVIREHSVGLVRHHLAGRPAAERRRAEPVLAMAANAEGDPAELRARILKLNQPGGEKTANTLWVAANALELEQYYREQNGETLRTRADTRKLAATTGRREAGMNTAGSSRSALSDLLSSPALPGLLGAAGQLVASNRGAGEPAAPAASSAPAGAPASAASQAAPGAAPLVSKLELPPANGEKKEEEKKDGEGKKADSKTGAGSGISGTRRYGQPERDLAASLSRSFGPAPLKGGLGGGGGSLGGDAAAASTAQAEEPRRAPASENGGYDFRGGGGGGDGGGSGSSAGASPSVPEPDSSALAKILEDPSVSPEESAAAAAAETGADGATLFHQVHSAYVRGLRAGRFEGLRQGLE